MLLAQGRFWSVTLPRGADAIEVDLNRGSADDDLRELRIQIPLGRWNRVLKHVRSDRKLLGGILLDFAVQKDQVSSAIGNDRLLGELQRVVVDATASLVESGALVLAEVEVGAG